MTSQPIVVRSGDRTAPPELQTPALHREQAFAEEGRWIGHVRTNPGEWSGWHHHAANDTYFYILRGELQIESADGDLVQAGTGDFVLVPNTTIHRERTPGQSVEAVVMRLGTGPTVVNVDRPEPPS